ncbi:MAG: hypothetical protein HY901_23070 [Deltaproteobacteria bacterium]|nr:hypothetical protein [Deltaproteobacteria bacterium]
MNVISLERMRDRLHAKLEDRARMAFIERDFQRALRDSRQALRYGSRCFQAHALHGDVLCALGREDDALAAYHQARRLAPGRAEPYWSVSTVHSLAGRWEQALRYLDLAQARLKRGDGPLYEWVAEDRAIALAKIGRRQEALDALRWGLRRRPRGVRLRELRAELTARAPPRSSGPASLKPVP